MQRVAKCCNIDGHVYRPSDLGHGSDAAEPRCIPGRIAARVARRWAKKHDGRASAGRSQVLIKTLTIEADGHPPCS